MPKQQNIYVVILLVAVVLLILYRSSYLNTQSTCNSSKEIFKEVIDNNSICNNPTIEKDIIIDNTNINHKDITLKYAFVNSQGNLMYKIDVYDVSSNPRRLSNSSICSKDFSECVQVATKVIPVSPNPLLECEGFDNITNTNSNTSSNSSSQQYTQQQWLADHNNYRKFHNAPPLTWDTDLESKANTWAQNLAATCCDPSSTSCKAPVTVGQGTNLSYGTHVFNPVNDWYNSFAKTSVDGKKTGGECDQYVYDSSFKSFDNWGHFAQVVLNDNNKPMSIGCATAVSPSCKISSTSGDYAVCYYSEGYTPDNYMSQVNVSNGCSQSNPASPAGEATGGTTGLTSSTQTPFTSTTLITPPSLISSARPATPDRSIYSTKGKQYPIEPVIKTAPSSSSSSSSEPDKEKKKKKKKDNNKENNRGKENNKRDENKE